MQLSLSQLALGAFVAFAGYIASYWIYNLFFHPLRSFPGPLFNRVSRLPYCYRIIKGTWEFDMLVLHKRYGPVVRVAPDELAFSDSAAWKDIMGHRSGGEEMMKWDGFYRPVLAGTMVNDIVFSGREEHGTLRRQIAHGFSDRAMREQEPIIRRYVDLLTQRLREKGGNGATALNMADWYNFTTFDVIGDLAFGDSFGCLESSDYHPWVKAIFEMGHVGTYLQAARHYPLMLRLILSMVPKSAMEKRKQHTEFTRAKLLKRMELGQTRPDLIEGLLKKKDEWNLSMDKLEANSSLLIIGGSETTATLLSGVTFLLLTNPHTLEKLTKEVRSTFVTVEEIDLLSVGRLTYMLACLDEALRMYPPVPLGLPRVVPRGGGMIAGKFVPEKTVVAVHQWATYHNDVHFKDPFQFHPERFLGDDRFQSDNKEALQPFHLGPRNCVGRNLAYAEMRLILARVIFTFDMRIADESRNWIDQKVWNLWKKGPLMVYLTPVKG